MKDIKIGILGCRVKPGRFAGLINGFDESEVAVIWDDRYDDVCEETARENNIIREKDLDRVFTDYDLTGVVIVTDNDRKKDLIIRAANAGLDIFVEKPLGVRAEDAYEIRDAVRKNNVKFYMSDPFVRRGLMKVKELIKEGILGDITGARFCIATGDAFYGNDAKYDKERSRGGIMADIGGHMIHQAHYIFGKPESLSANFGYYTEKAKESGTEENAVVSMKYPGGVMVTIEASWVSGVNTSSVEIRGTKGAAVIVPYGKDPSDEKVTLRLENGEEKELYPDDLPPKAEQHVRYFIDMIAKDLPNDIVGRDPQSNSGVSIDNAVEFVEVIEAIYESAAKDSAVVTVR